jgi:hypothetical protein
VSMQQLGCCGSACCECIFLMCVLLCCLFCVVLLIRLLPQWVAAGDHPASCQSLLPQLPAANVGTLKLLMQVGKGGVGRRCTKV